MNTVKTTPPDAYQKALSLLVRREHSKQELKRKLTVKGVSMQEADQALAALSNKGFQDDNRFAEHLARYRANAGYGPVRIRAELCTHKLADALIEATIANLDMCWLTQAKALVTRRFRLEDQQDRMQKRKAITFLLRRGFSRDQAYAAVNEQSDSPLG